jgi:hypothetical protein
MSKEFLRDQRQKILDSWMYSVQRIDLLIISISGGGIYVALKTLEFIKEHQMYNPIIIKIAGLLFVAAIVLNFSGQYCGLKLHEFDSYVNYYETEETNSRGKSDNSENIKHYNKKVAILDKICSFLNYSCGILMLTGLFLIAWHFVTF